jgi:hypothetical protein
MTLARLAALLLFCCLPAVAQQSTDFFAVDKSAKTLPDFSTLRDAPSQPWQIVPNPPAELSSGQDRIRVDQFRLDQGKVNGGPHVFTFKVAPHWDGSLDADATCYTMRSYVVARDSNNSDSTHLVSYSTCQPAARYGVKTTEQGPRLLER